MNRSESGKLGYIKAKEVMQASSRRQHDKAVQKFGVKYCIGCNVLMAFKQRDYKYCSLQCAIGTLNKNRRKTAYCKVCNKKLKTQQNMCCSRACSDIRIYSEYIVKWLKGEVVGGSWAGVSAHVRKWLIKTRGEKCELCGWNKTNPTTGLIPLQVDHIDGNPMNHRPENLRLLDPSCHSLTPTYGGLNRGKGRKQRYASIG
jgi:hypothetical protein